MEARSDPVKNRRRTRLGWVVMVAIELGLLAGCRVTATVIRHDEQRAASEAAQILSLVYIARDYDRASERMHPERRVARDELARLVARVEAEHGAVQGIARDSFLPMPGQNAMSLFFTADNEKGSTYHRVTVLGDADGYRVTGVDVQGEPYPLEQLRQAFRQSQ
jgi:hypothetical protein